METKKFKGHRLVDIAGQRFGQLVAIRPAQDRNRWGNVVWECFCECGRMINVVGSALRSGNTQSCGCTKAAKLLAANTKHGHAKKSGETRAYMIWSKMLSRCHTPTSKDYKYYGGRGIFVCDRWRQSFDNFLLDMGEPSAGFTLERKKNCDGYSKENCTWASRKVQANNARSNVMIETPTTVMTLAQFARFTGLNYDNLRAKLSRGVSVINGIEIKHFKRGDSEFDCSNLEE